MTQREGMPKLAHLLCKYFLRVKLIRNLDPPSLSLAPFGVANTYVHVCAFLKSLRK